MRFQRVSAVVPAVCAVMSLGVASAVAQQASAGGDTTFPLLSGLGLGNGSESVAAKQGASAAALNAPLPPYALARGVSLTLNYTGEAAGNPVGGISQGSAYAGQVFLGLDFDLNTLLNDPGGAIHFAETQRHGDNLAATHIGNNTSVQEVYGTQNLHLALLTYEQKFLNDRLDIEVGRTVANVAFLGSPIYCNFQSNSTCGNPTLIFKDSNFTYFPAVSWGGHARYLLTDKIYFHIGAYEQNPDDKSAYATGYEFSTRHATGATIPFELGYGTDFSNDYLPRHYQVGGWYDASQYSDPYLNAAGMPAVLTGGNYETHFGRSGFFARFDQMITRPDPDTARGLTVFGVFMTNTSGRVQENQFYELGLLQTGTFKGRDADTIGLLVDDQKFSGLFLDNILAARTLAGGTSNIPGHEIMMELNYGLQINSSVRLVPNLQYIINPDQSAEPGRTTNIPNAFIIGGKFTVDISTIMNQMTMAHR